MADTLADRIEPFGIHAIRLGGMNISVLIGFGLIALIAYKIQNPKAPDSGAADAWRSK